MNRIPLKAQERVILGKKVRTLRREGFVPANVYGNKVESESVSVNLVDFLKVYKQTGESGLIDLKIGEEKIKPVLVRDVQIHALSGAPLHIDFYQVNLKESVRVTVPVVLKGEEPELVHTGEAVVIQPISEIEVEALPTELPEHIEVDITPLKVIGDSILVSSLQVPEAVTVHADAESVVVKLDNAITEEMQKLLEEQAAEQAAASAAAATEAGATEGTEAESTETEAGDTAEGEAPTEAEVTPTEEQKSE